MKLFEIHLLNITPDEASPLLFHTCVPNDVFHATPPTIINHASLKLLMKKKKEIAHFPFSSFSCPITAFIPLTYELCSLYLLSPH